MKRARDDMPEMDGRLPLHAPSSVEVWSSSSVPVSSATSLPPTAPPYMGEQQTFRTQGSPPLGDEYSVSGETDTMGSAGLDDGETAFTKPRRKSQHLSCVTCRRRKVKCEPARTSGPAYPCARCVRLKLECIDPQLQEKEEAEYIVRHMSLLRVMGKGIHQLEDGPTERVKVLLGFFTNLYRRRIIGGVVTLDGVEANHYRELIRTLLSHCNTDAESYIASLTPMVLPPQVVLNGRFVTHDGVRGQQLHPYVAALYHEGYATMGNVIIRGTGRFLGTSSFHRHFFTEQEAERVWTEEEVLPPVILGSVFPQEERARFERCVRDLMVENLVPSAERTEMFKVRLRKFGATVMALVRLRLQLLLGGDYFSMVIAMTPLPLRPVPQRMSRRIPTGSKRAVLQCAEQDDPWVECAKTFGDFSEHELCLGPALEGTSFAVETGHFPIFLNRFSPVPMPTVGSGMPGEYPLPPLPSYPPQQRLLLEASSPVKVEATEEGRVYESYPGWTPFEPQSIGGASSRRQAAAEGSSSEGGTAALLPEDLLYLNEVFLSEEPPAPANGGGYEDEVSAYRVVGLEHDNGQSTRAWTAK